MIKNLLTTKDAAKLLGVSNMTIRNLTDNGQLKCIKIGKHRRFTRDDINKFFFERMSIHLLRITIYHDEIKYFKNLSNEDKELLWHGIFPKYWQLIHNAVVRDLKKLIGTKEGMLRKLVDVCFPEDEKENGYEIIIQIKDNMTNISNFRNVSEHRFFEKAILAMEEIEQVLKLLFALFDKARLGGFYFATNTTGCIEYQLRDAKINRNFRQFARIISDLVFHSKEPIKLDVDSNYLAYGDISILHKDQILIKFNIDIT